jgi:hypothetical protein
MSKQQVSIDKIRTPQVNWICYLITTVPVHYI